VSVGQLISLLGKLGGLAVGVIGVNAHSLEEMTVGGAFTAILHGIDSIFNSPKGSSPPL
jgi:hypothetical protein